MNAAELLAELDRIETALLEERDRLAREAAALDAVAAGECAAAALIVGLLPAFIVGLRRFCAGADVVEAETRRDALLTAIGAIETAASRLPSVADLEDPERQARAVESLRLVARAVRGISGLGDLSDDVLQALQDAADDVRDVGEGLETVAIGLGLFGLAMILLRG